jgi:hypothetical protein
MQQHHSRLARRTVALVLSSLVLLLSTACQGDHSATSGRPQSLDVNAPPKQVVEQLKQALAQPPINLPAESVKDGTIVTGWERHRGDFHVARYWQERTRYTIQVVPDWNNPTGVSRLQISQETQQRATNGQEWQPAPGLDRGGRSQDVLEKLQAQLKTSTTQATN